MDLDVCEEVSLAGTVDRVELSPRSAVSARSEEHPSAAPAANDDKTTIARCYSIAVRAEVNEKALTQVLGGQAAHVAKAAPTKLSLQTERHVGSSCITTPPNWRIAAVPKYTLSLRN